MRIQYRLGLRELIELNGAARMQRLISWICVGMGCPGLLVGAWQVFFGNGDDALLLIASGLVFVLLGVLSPWLAGGGVWARGCPVMDIEITPEGVRFCGPPNEELIEWAKFSGWKTTRLLFILEIGLHDSLAFPKRCFPPELLPEVESWLLHGFGKEST